jgi:hypothetical protein
VTAIAVVYLAQYRGMQPLDGNGVDSIVPYKDELSEIRAYSGPKPTDSPDGRHTARMEELLSGNPLELIIPVSSWRRIIVTRNYGARERHYILAIQESDPGSGLSYHYQWSKDSNALFIFGCGRPNGESSSRDLSFIYLPLAEKLYEVAVVNQPARWC